MIHLGCSKLLKDAPGNQRCKISSMQKLPQSFSATLQKSIARGGWTYVVWPKSVAFFGTRGRVKVRGTIWGFR